MKKINCTSGYCVYLETKEEKQKGGMEIFLLENPDGSGWGMQYRHDRKAVFEVFQIERTDERRESIITVSGISRVLKKMK